MQYNALQSIQAFEAGTGARKERERETAMKGIGNALAGGDWSGGAASLFKMGEFDAGMKAAEYGKGLEDAAAEEKRVGLIRYGMGLLNTPAPQREAMRGQIAQALGGMGIQLDEQSAAAMDLSDEGIRATLMTLQDTDGLMQMYQAQFAQPEHKVVGSSLVEIGPDGVKPVYTAPDKPVAPMSTIGKLAADLQAARITQAQYDAEVARMSRPPVQVNMDGNEGWKFAPPPSGYGYAPNPNAPGGVELVPIQGGPAASEIEADRVKKEQNLGGTELTVGNLIGAYATLAKNRAITSQGNDALSNIGAIYSRTPVGKFQDEIGGGVGNLENAEARQTIDGLSMNALMKMISMSDVSAKAMDSDAEMKAWLSAIKSDNYEAALTKLHVLDVSFGKGTALQQAYANGVIDLETYQRVTRRMNSDPMTKQMADRARRYAELGQAVGVDNLTPSEQAELPDGFLIVE